MKVFVSYLKTNVPGPTKACCATPGKRAPKGVYTDRGCVGRTAGKTKLIVSPKLQKRSGSSRIGPTVGEVSCKEYAPPNKFIKMSKKA